MDKVRWLSVPLKRDPFSKLLSAESRPSGFYDAARHRIRVLQFREEIKPPLDYCPADPTEKNYTEWQDVPIVDEENT